MVFSGSSPITTTSPSSKAHQKSGSFPPPTLLGFNGRTTLSELPPEPSPCRDVEAATLAHDGSPPITRTIFPTCACSGFTHVTAHRIAQPPKATFVTRLQPCRLPSRAARQLPDQSTILRVESSSTDVSRLRGARPVPDIVGIKRPGIILAGWKWVRTCHSFVSNT